MTPELSIVIPTFNRAERMSACLGALAAQTQPPTDFEVIVIIDGSTDQSESVLRELSTPFALHVATQERRGRGAARNRGAEIASGRYLLFLDDHLIAAPEVVYEHLHAQREHDGAVVIGPSPKVLPRRANWFARCDAQERLTRYQSLQTRPPTFIDCWGGNVSVPRTAFRGVGGFATDLQEEETIELGYRLQEAGLPFVFAPGAVAHEDDRETSRERIADAELRGAISLELWRRHPPIVSSIELGGKDDLGRKWIALRRALLWLHVPPRVVALCGALLPRPSWRRSWYRLLSSYCYWRGVRRKVPDRDTWRRLIRGTPILMYHAIGAPGERASRYVLPARRFSRQMRWLRLLRYRVIGLDELIRCRLEHRLPPAKAVVITFDDGYSDNRSVAAPILEQLGFPATVFLVSAAGSQSGWMSQARFSGRSLMEPGEARELVGGVITFGAHSRTHPDLTSVEQPELRSEVEGSRTELEAALGVPIAMFAYPYGRTNDEVREAVREAGFAGACSVDSGRNRLSVDPLALKRLEVRGTDSLLRFASTLWVGETHSLLRGWR